MLKQLNISFFYWLIFITTTVIVLALCQHYIDFTDQGFYLIHVDKPDEVTIVANAYHLYLETLYSFLNENIAHYRMFCVIILLLSSVPLVYCVHNYLLDKKYPEFIPVALLGTISFYSQFIITPNYNWSNIIGLLFFSAGIILYIISFETRVKWIISGALIGMSGWICFVSKPPTAVAIGLVYGMSLLWSWKKDGLSTRLIMTFISSVVMLVGCLLIHFGVLDNFDTYIMRVKNAMIALSLVDGGYSLKDQFFSIGKDIALVSVYSTRVLAIVIPLLLIGTYPKFSLHIKNNPKLFLAFCGTMVFFVMLYKGFYQENFIKGGATISFFVAFFTIFFAYILLYYKNLQIQLDAARLVLVTLILATTYFYKIGSNVNYVALGNMCGVFYVVAIVAFTHISLLHDRALLFNRYMVFPLMTLVCLGAITQSLSHPYRSQTNVYNQHYATTMSSDPTNILYLDNAAHGYITAVQSLFEKNNFQHNTLLIDLSGATPLVNHVINAKSPPYPWLIGGYEGSKEAALNNLNSMEPSDIQNAWILIPTSQTPRSLNPSLLNEIGLNFPRDYTKIGFVPFTVRNNEVHEFWKPKK